MRIVQVTKTPIVETRMIEMTTIELTAQELGQLRGILDYLYRVHCSVVWGGPARELLEALK